MQTETVAETTPVQIMADGSNGNMKNAAWVARFLGVSQPWVRRHADDGDLPGYNYGNSWRFDEGEIRHWKLDKRNGASLEQWRRLSADGDPADGDAK